MSTPPVREASTKPSAATVLPAPVACSNQKRLPALGSSGASSSSSSTPVGSSQSRGSSGSSSSSASSSPGMPAEASCTSPARRAGSEQHGGVVAVGQERFAREAGDPLDVFG